MAVTTFETFDLRPQPPHTRAHERRAVASDGSRGPSFARQLDERPLDFIDYSQRFATTIRIQRLRDLFNRTLYGVLPMEVDHEELGTIPVVFVDVQEVQRRLNSAEGIVTVELRRWIGYR